MAWTRRIWQNKPNTSTPVSAAALNNIEDGVEEAVTATRGRLSDANLTSTFVTAVTTDDPYNGQSTTLYLNGVEL